MERVPVFAANWKMNHLRSDAESFVDQLAGDPQTPGREVVLFPASPLLARVSDRLSRHRALGRFALGGQDVHPESSGAHTGDVSTAQLKDAGCTWVLCGHSERRADHDESDRWIGRKLAASLEAGLTSVLCVGETLDQRDAGNTEEVLGRQLDGAGCDRGSQLGQLGDLSERLVVAYEPVWAIGTGQSATPDIAQNAHEFLRQELRQRFGPTDGDRIRLLYGGSVKPANCRELFALPDVDGFLIGGASLDPGSFLDIIHRCGF